MLKIIQIENPHQIEDLFKSFDAQIQSWVVSDLRTKLELQKLLIERQGYFLESSVLRASDLWRMLLKRLNPNLRVISKDFARTLVRSFISEHAETFGINVTSEKTLFRYMNQFSSLALAAGSDELLSKWFNDNPEIAARWQSWYLIARTALRWLIHDHHVIVSDWVPSYLQEVDGLETVWDRSLYVDLGSEISNVEAEVFQRLSHSQDITVIEPRPHWRADFTYLLQPYEYLRRQTQNIFHPSLDEIRRPTQRVRRMSGALAEVKMACAEARQLLESGVPASSVAIIAPDIESYWPVLSEYLEQEGIPVQKERTVKLQALPGLHQWLATLRAQTSRVSAADLEASFYARSESNSLRYEEFKALFKVIYGQEDLSRDKNISDLYKKTLSLDNNINRDEFLAEALKAWANLDSDTEILITVLREIFQNVPSKVKLAYRDWLTYLENILATKEWRVKSGAVDGLVVCPLMSAQSYKMAHKIFLGLSEESLKDRNGRSHILGADLNRLALDLGFYLEHPDHSYKEFQLRWLSEGAGEQNTFSFGLADFSGALLSPSNFWMSFNPPEELFISPPTRWDCLSGISDGVILGLRERDEEEQQRMESRFLIDLGKKPLPGLELDRLPSLSASQIEKYLKCPFTFAASKVFHLQDHPELDLDEDPRTRGTFAHALFEFLLRPDFRSTISDDDLNQILEDLKDQQGMRIADPRLWSSMKKRYFNLAKRFIKFEIDWRMQFPGTKTIAAEKDFIFFFDPNSGEISQQEKPGTLRFSGKIDRIDCHRDETSLVVIDYKSSTASYKNHAAWFDNVELQLLFYMWALEKEAFSDITGQVIGAFYYSFKDFNRNKGFQIEEYAGPLFAPAGRRGVKASTDDKKELLEKFELLLLEMIDQMKRGEIPPRPYDVKICEHCEWNGLCRAPHLN